MRCELIGLGWVTAAGLGRGRDGACPGLPAGALPEIRRADIFDRPDRQFGRLDAFSRLGVAAAALALQDAGWELGGEARQPVGLVAGSVYGCLVTDAAYFDTVVPEGGTLASPHLFAYTLPNTFLGEVAIRFGLTGGATVLNTPADSGATALCWGLESLAWGDAPAMVIGQLDLVPNGQPETSGALFAVIAPAGSGPCPLAALDWSPAKGLRVRDLPVTDLLQLARLATTDND